MARASIGDRAAYAHEKAKEMLDGGGGGGVVSKARSLVSGDAQFFSNNPKFDQIRKQLDSDSIGEKKDGMKRVIAGICKGNDMSAMFPDVVKNIHVASIELRKLVYYFIVHYAEERPNESLLSISAFQKDLLDHSMHVRSLALRVLSSLRIPAINPVVMVAIKKASTDMSSVVRKTSAISLSQAHFISGEDNDQELIVQLLHQFLGDRSPEVVGAAALSFCEICPNQFELIHKHFRKICRSLVDCDEWGQVILLHVLSRYARTQFTNPDGPTKKDDNEEDGEKKEEKREEKDSDDSSDDSDDDKKSSSSSEDILGNDDNQFSMDSDHRLLLNSVKPLFHSLNRAVVIQACSLYFHCAPREELDLCVKPLLRILMWSTDAQEVILSAIHTLVLSRPTPFISYVKDFYITAEDPAHVRELKIRILSKLCTSHNYVGIIHEFRSYLRSYDKKKVVVAIQGLGWISASVADCSTQIMRLITPLLSHNNPDVVTACVGVLRQLVVQGTDETQTCKLVHKLLMAVVNNEIKAPAARASVLWLVGENISTHISIAKAAPDLFRMFAKTFPREEPCIKQQVLTLGAKLWLHLDGEGELADRFRKIFFYVLELVKYDNNYEVRDQGRIIGNSLDRSSETFASYKECTLAPKPKTHVNDPFAEKAKYQLGSLSHLFGNALLGYQELPEWPDKQPDPTVRDPPGEGESSEEESGLDYSSSYSSSGYGSSSGSSSGGSTSSSAASSESDDDDDGKESEDNSSSEEEDARPAPKPAPKRIVTRVVTKPGEKPQDKMIDSMFKGSFGSKPKAAAAAAPEAHVDPQPEAEAAKKEEKEEEEAAGEEKPAEEQKEEVNAEEPKAEEEEKGEVVEGEDED